MIAVVLLLRVLGGSFASEYAVDAVNELIESPDTALVYTLQDGRKADPTIINSTKETSTKISPAATFIADRCCYFDEETKSYRVNVTFINATTEEKACFDKNPTMSYQVSDVCLLTERGSHESTSVWNGQKGFAMESSRGLTLENSWVMEANDRNRSIVTYLCDFQQCN